MRKTLAALVALILCSSAPQALAQSSNDIKDGFELVQKIGSRRAYEVFLRTHPTGPYADLVRKRLDQMKPARAPDPQRRTQPNWGDDIFIPRLMDRQK